MILEILEIIVEINQSEDMIYQTTKLNSWKFVLEQSSVEFQNGSYLIDQFRKTKLIYLIYTSPIPFLVSPFPFLFFFLLPFFVHFEYIFFIAKTTFDYLMRNFYNFWNKLGKSLKKVCKVISFGVYSGKEENFGRMQLFLCMRMQLLMFT